MTHARSIPLPEGQAELLEMIARGAPLPDTLKRLTLLIEAQSEGLYCTILLLDPDGSHIHPGAGPSMPVEYMNSLEGFPIGPTAGSCGTAMYKKEAVVVTDILEDPLWASYRFLIEPHGFRACWSTPIFLNRDTVLGSFAMYYRSVRSPGSHEMQLMAVATHIAGIAIERERNEKELRRYHHELESLVQERTTELRAEKERVETVAVALSQSNHELASALNSLSAAQEELVRSKKLAGLGSLVAGIAHELNTPIGNCMMTASTFIDQTNALRERFAEQGSVKRSDLNSYFDDACKAGELLERNLQRLDNLISGFKQVAVDQTNSNRRNFLLDVKIDEILQILESRLRKSPFVIERDIAEGLQFDSFPGALGQIIASLIDNAIVHGFEGRSAGRITVSAKPDKKGWVELCVKDDGVGIAAANLDRIFDPFFTTKLGTGGSGLGLNIVYNTVTGVLGGKITVSSEPGQGTVVRITLPVVAPQLVAAARR